MRGLRLILVVLACAGVVCAWAPAGALASGCNGSAGDSQYVDPLANCNPPSSGGGGGSGGGSSSQTGSSTATTPSQTATIASSATTTTHRANSSSSKDPSSGKTLPFTGLDLVPALIVAAALLGSGLALRRLTGDAR